MQTADTPPRPRVRNPRGQGARLHEELAVAGLRVLDNGGVQALTLRAVAREAEVAAPSIYRQYADLQALTAEIARQCFNELGNDMVTQRDQFQQAVPRLLACCRAYADFVRQHPHRYALLFSRDSNVVAAGPEGPTDTGAAVFKVFLAAVVACTAESGDAAIMTAAAIWSSVDGYARLQAHRAHFTWPEQEAMLRRIVKAHTGIHSPAS